jgi:hypothetical protein
MKTITSNAFRTLIVISTFFLLTIACNQKKEKTGEMTHETTVTQDSLSAPIPKDSLAATAATADTIGKEKPVIEQPPTPKICEPNFNLLGMPQRGQKIFYVSGFNPGEFKCWELLESHGTKTCENQPCVIYYMDKPIRTFTTVPPHFMNSETLKANGIGRFQSNGKDWELKGSSQWGRKEKGYAYYNTNAGGGG